MPWLRTAHQAHSQSLDVQDGKNQTRIPHPVGNEAVIPPSSSLEVRARGFVLNKQPTMCKALNYIA